MSETLEFVSKNVRTFTNNLANIILPTQEGNLSFSPPSLFILLCTIYQGASDNVAKTLKSVLNVIDPSTSVEDCKELLECLDALDEMNFCQSYAIFLREITDVVSEFSKIAKRTFRTSVQDAFRKDEKKGQSDKKINAWIEEQTSGRITHIIEQQDFDEYTTGMIVAGIHWKVDWLEKASFYECKKDSFYISERETIKCQMLKMVCHIKYSERDDIDSYVMAIPYKGAHCSLMVFLPRTRMGLKHLQSKLFNMNLAEIHEDLNPCPAVVVLPKIKVENTVNLRGALTQMGLGDLFNGCGHFSGIFQNAQFNAKGFIHKVIVETGEEGEEVLDEAGLNARTRRYQSETPSHSKIAFSADHPYIFCICYHRNCFFPLVMGKIEKPK